MLREENRPVYEAALAAHTALVASGLSPAKAWDTMVHDLPAMLVDAAAAWKRRRTL